MQLFTNSHQLDLPELGITDKYRKIIPVSQSQKERNTITLLHKDKTINLFDMQPNLPTSSIIGYRILFSATFTIRLKRVPSPLTHKSTVQIKMHTHNLGRLERLK